VADQLTSPFQWEPPMRTPLPAVLAAALILSFAGPTWAGPNVDGKFALHVVEALSSDPCLHTSAIPTCAFVQTSALPFGVPLYVYVLVYGDATAGIGGARFGIDYAPPNIFQVFNWTICADNQVGFNWPGAQSGLEVTWNPGNCQNRTSGINDPVWDTGSAVVGYFYCAAYGPAQMSIIPHPQDSRATITACSGVVDDVANLFPSHLGVAGFNGNGGYSPCAVLDIYPCYISGPSEMAAGSTRQFTGSNNGDTFHWSIEGNGVIVGPSDQLSVNVQATGPGSLTLYLGEGTVIGIPGYLCGKVVTVADATPVRSASWSAIKALYR
jgi:hypothetical protein